MPVAIDGEFSVGIFGLDAKRWSVLALPENEAQELLQGGETERAAAQIDFDLILQKISESDGSKAARVRRRLSGGVRLALSSRCRGTPQSSCLSGRSASAYGADDEVADALCTAYPALNRDLLIAGVLVHDCGKLWEMCPSETSFEIPRDLRGELLGHISIGIEVVNALWRKLPLENWKEDLPPPLQRKFGFTCSI